MKLTVNLSEKLNWIFNTLYFFKQHFRVILGLGLIAAFGRTIQLGAFGEISSLLNIFLEVIVESSRLLIFVYTLGFANIKSGVLIIKQIITNKDKRKLNWSIAMQKVKSQWLSILLSIIVYLIIAFFINYLIDLLAYETCLYISLRRDGIISEFASEWAIILFFKNLSVIPLTFIFYAMFLLWATNKFKKLAT